MPINTINVTLRNKQGSILVVHNFGEKAKQEIRDKQEHKARTKKGIRDTNAEFLANRYVDTEGRECIPVTALKKAIVSAASAFDDLTKVGLRQAVFVDALDSPGASLIPLLTPTGKPAIGTIREDAVTIGINTRGLAYRPQYSEWTVRLRIEFNPRLVSEAQLVALIEQAGWGVGICEGRPEKTSALGWGRFEIHGAGA